MGAFKVDCELQELTGKQPPVSVAGVMVDTGSEYTWLPQELLAQAGVALSKRDLAFVMANGTRITRDVGYAYLRSSGFETVDEVVFARPDDCACSVRARSRDSPPWSTRVGSGSWPPDRCRWRRAQTVPSM